jgi:two-component system, LytTR family, response regulator
VGGALRVAIVDDEPLAREGLRLRLARMPDVRIVAECGEAGEAVRVLQATECDALFLDVQMPELDGFGVLARIERGPLPAVILVTAHAEHALRAFRVGALDYLVKPYDDETLRESVERARAHVARVRESGGAPGVPELPAGAAAPLARLTVKREGRVLFVETARIDWVESVGDHVRVHAGGESHLIRSTMQALARRLDPARFVRVHRTAIVAMPSIRELQPYSRGEYVVVLGDGTRLPLSRRYRAKVVGALEGSR